MRTAVVGGGISGLSLAHRLAEAGQDVTCFEPGRPGGLIHSERHDGYLCEAGPDGLMAGAPDTTTLIDELGLRGDVMAASPLARRRLVYLGGRCRVVPTDPFSLLASDLLTTAGKWRLMRETWIRPRAANDTDDESVQAFGERRLGAEAARHLLAPAAIGIFAGDAARLSLTSAFPRLHALELQHGSLLRGLKTLRKTGEGPGRTFSFREGLEQLPRALTARLGERLQRGRIEHLARAGTGWQLVIEGSSHAFDRVVLACPNAVTATLLGPLAAGAGRALGEIRTVPMAVVSLGFTRPPAGVDLEGYGVLVARGEGPRLLGCQFESSVFPASAPPGRVLLRALLGGVFDPEVGTESEDSLVVRTRDDLRTVLGLTDAPDFTRVDRWPVAIPQYEIGHGQRLGAIDDALASLPGLHVLGHGLRGMGVNACIREAAALARRLV